VDWVMADLSRHSEFTATQVVSCFQHPRFGGERDVGTLPMPDGLVKLKAEFIERSN
jgi:hypothetical protein